MFNTPKVETPATPTPIDPKKVGLNQQDELAKRRARRFGAKQTLGTSALGATDFGQNTRKQVELMGQ
ncbi:MAG: hypothetical protein JKY34_09230 [Kordiimonadaceae bacterium]|nr:hypothetical protein [Kordiimonadaceae bacterium]